MLAAALGMRSAVARQPFGGMRGWVVVPAVALVGLTAWVLLSATWSDAAGRALVEHLRPLAYVLAFVLLGSVPYTPQRLRFAVRATAVAFAAIALAGLVARVLPEVWSAPPSYRPGRLSYPLTYWNAMGIVSAMGALLCVHLACDPREHAIVRALGAAAVPGLAATILLTFSRGSIAAGIAGIVLYLVLGRPGGVLVGLAATVPTSVVAVIAAYGADAITGDDPTGAAAVAEGQDVAVVVGLCMLCGAVVAGLLSVVTARRAARRGPRERRGVGLSRRTRAVLAVAAAAVAVVAGVAAGAPAAIDQKVDRFWAGDEVPAGSSDRLRERLSDVGNGGRREHWQVALDGFDDAPLRGQGAGTYATLWDRERPNITEISDAHSLYLETLGELGVVGLVAILVVVLVIGAGLVVRARGPAGAPAAAAAAVWLTWALHAGFDWDWEMLAVTLPIFALAGAGLARARRGVRSSSAPAGPHVAVRLAVVAALVVLAILPVRVADSQSRLDTALAALLERDCRAARPAAADAVRALPARAEGWQALGLCELIDLRPDEAAVAMREAARRDPDNWEPFYGLAIARAAAGRDPRPALREAAARNPREALVEDLAEDAAQAPRPRRWEQLARRAPLVLPQ